MGILMIAVLFGITGKASAVMCSQCDSDIDPDCSERPPPPRNCTLCTSFDRYTERCTAYQEVDYCIIERRYVNETMIRITRDCSPQAMPSVCELTELTIYGTPIKVCFTTCSHTGCNSGSKHSTNMLLLVLMWLFSLTEYVKR